MVRNLSEALIIIRENIGDEFARRVKEVCKEEYEPSENMISELKETIEYLEMDLNAYEDVEESLDYLEDRLDELREYIEKNDNGTDYMNGMRKAYKMIER